VGGLALALTGTIRGDIFAGYYDQTYDANDRDISFTNFGSSLTWSMTPLTSLQADIERSVRPTVFGNASDTVRTDAELTLAHSFTNELLASSSLRYIEDEFVNIGTLTEREDETYMVDLEADYALMRGLSAQAGLRYFDRQSTLDAQQFSNEIIRLGLRYRY
jgi:uncharacterized protein (PEP-CTERM system associated)